MGKRLLAAFGVFIAAIAIATAVRLVEVNSANRSEFLSSADAFSKRLQAAEPPAKTAATAGQALEGDGTAIVQRDEQAKASPIHGQSKQRYSWKEIDKILDDLRSERKERAQAGADLRSWYIRLAGPSFT